MNATTRTLEELLQHERFVQRLARSLLGSDDEADDLVQETWLRAVQHPPDSPVLGWLGTVMRNLSRDRRIGASRREKREQDVARPEATPPLQQVIEREEVRRAILKALGALPENHASAIVLRFFEGLPPREIARQLSVPVETVKKRLARGLIELREQLDGTVDGGRAGWTARFAALVGAPATAKAASVAAGVLLMSSIKTASLVGIVILCAVIGWVVVKPWASPTEPDLSGSNHEAAARPESPESPTTTPQIRSSQHPGSIVPRPSMGPETSVEPPRYWRVRAVDRNRSPVSGAGVTVNDRAVGTTDADGFVDVSFPQEIGAKVAAKIGGLSGLSEVEDTAPVFDIVLTGAWTLRVTVLDAVGSPVRQAIVEGLLGIDGLAVPMPSKGSTNDAGLFVWSDIPSGTVYVSASHSNRYAKATVQGWAQHVGNIVLRLNEGRQIEVTAIDDEGKPLPNLELTACGPERRDPPTLNGHTDGSGRLMLACPASWNHVHLAVASDEWFLDPSEQTHQMSEAGPIHVVIRLTRAVALELRVHNRGVPTHGLRASAEFSRGYFRDSVGHAGVLQFQQLPSSVPFSVHFFVHDAHLHSLLFELLPPGKHSRDVELNLTPLTVRVTDDAGKAVSTVVNAYATDGRNPHPRFGTAGPLMLNARTDHQGTARMNLPPGSYGVRSIENNEVTAETYYNVGTSPAELALVVVRPKPWRIQLKSTDDKALSGWGIALENSEHVYSAMTDAEGFTAFHAADGAYDVFVRSPLGLTHLAESNRSPSDLQQVTIVLEHYTITTINLVDGAPIPARVFVAPARDAPRVWERISWRGIAIGTSPSGTLTIETAKSDWTCWAIADNGARSEPRTVSAQDPSREVTLVVFESHAPMADLRTDNEQWVIDWRIAVEDRTLTGRFTLRGSRGVIRVRSLPIGPLDLTIVEGPAGVGKHFKFRNEPGAVLVLPDK